jgi:hypothetical protein
MIDAVTTKFLDATLLNDRTAWQWLDSQQCAAHFGHDAKYERH